MNTGQDQCSYCLGAPGCRGFCHHILRKNRNSSNQLHFCILVEKSEKKGGQSWKFQSDSPFGYCTYFEFFLLP